MYRILLLIILLVGCQLPHSYQIDPAFTPSERNEIVQAAEQWNAITRPDHRIRFDGARWYIAKESPVAGYDGWTNAATKRVSLNPQRPVYTLALHEFGHTLGLNHTINGVMHPTATSTIFSAEDIAECIRVNACD